MGHNTRYIAGPLMTVAGAALMATGAGGPIGLPLMMAGLGETAGGPQGAMIGGTAAAGGQAAFPSLGPAASSALGGVAERLGLGRFVSNNPGAIAAALKSNPALRGITPDMIMPDNPAAAAPATAGGGAAPMNNWQKLAAVTPLAGPAMQAYAMSQQRPPAPAQVPMPAPQPPIPYAAMLAGGGDSMMLDPRLRMALGMG